MKAYCTKHKLNHLWFDWVNENSGKSVLLHKLHCYFSDMASKTDQSQSSNYKRI